MTWQLFALASAFFASLTAIFGKLGVQEMNSNLATFLRTLVVMLFSALLISFRHEWQAPKDLTARGVLFLLLSGIATGLSWLCYYRALQLGPVSKVAPVDKLSVLFVVVLSLIFLGEALTWKVALGTLMIGSGVIVLAL